jgi:hypothetical protein
MTTFLREGIEATLREKVFTFMGLTQYAAIVEDGSGDGPARPPASG